MNLLLNQSLASNYKSGAQISRVLTEDWANNNLFCLNCGNDKLSQFENNSPVADFYCSLCKEEYELKSKNGSLGKKIVDGAYQTMCNRIMDENNPNFFFLTYDKTAWKITNSLIIPKYYFVAGIIEKRNPLSSTARRAGWTGCNILLSKIPSKGCIFIVQNSKPIPKDKVIESWKSTEFLTTFSKISKGWVIDVMSCIDDIKEKRFTLQQVYEFENVLKVKYPKNNFIKDKIRQQLQILRNKGVINFRSRGVYEKN